MKTLTTTEYDTLIFRTLPDAKLCCERCKPSCRQFGSGVGYDESVLRALVERGLLTKFACQHVQGAWHFFTNPDGHAALVLYNTIKSLDDLKLTWNS